MLRGKEQPLKEGIKSSLSDEESNNENDDDYNYNDSSVRSHVCEECGMSFKERSHLATHKRKHTTERRFKCNECGICFKTKSSLHFHMGRHAEAPFICQPCNKEYSERKQLMRHIRVVHASVNR